MEALVMTNEKTQSDVLLIRLYISDDERYSEGGEHEFRRSVDSLKSQLKDLDVKAAGVYGGCYSAWPGFLDLAALIGSSGLAVGIYNLLRLWVESRNGRRIRIKIGEFEVEATQLDQESFVKLVETIRGLRNTSVALDTSSAVAETKKEVEEMLLKLSDEQHRYSTFERDITPEEILFLYNKEQED